MNVLSRVLVAFAVLLLTPGCCLMLGNTSTARTLERGTGEVGLTFGSTTYQFETTTFDDPDTPEDEGGEKQNLNVTFPVILPEIPFGIAITDDVQFGGRFAPQSLGFELNTKVRFLHADRLHMAVMPSINYQSWLLVQGTGVRLPMLVTYDVTDILGFTTSVHAAYTDWSFADEDFEPDDDEDQNTLIWNGGLASFGMGAGLDIHTESFFVRPTFEFNRYQSNLNKDFEETFEPFNSYAFMLNIGFVIGKTKKQLDRMEQKIDRISPPPPAPAPPSPPPGNESASSAVPMERKRWMPDLSGAGEPRDPT